MSEQSAVPRPLPARPSLEYLRKLAKDRLEALRRGDASARLADAQRHVAREHGFASWRKLHAHVVQAQRANDATAHGSAPDAVREEFFSAIRRGDEAALDRLLRSAPHLVNARHADGSTALSVAAEMDHPRVVELLLGRGADAGAVYAHSAHTALSWAVTVGSFDAARALVRGGVKPDLFCAAGMGDAEAVRSFFEPDGRLVTGASTTGSSRYATDGTRLPCPPTSAREIVADALYVACRHGQLATVPVLLGHDPDLSFRAFAGGTPLHWAYFAGARTIVDRLLQAGADPMLLDDGLGCTPKAFGICWPASVGWTPKVRERLAADPTLVDAVSRRGTPLHEAAWGGYLEAVTLLVEAGADTRRRNAAGKTALDLARERPEHGGCVKVADWLSARPAAGA